MDIKRFFVYAIVIAALALAGCSSDGNGVMTETPPPPPPTPEERIEAAQMTAGTAQTAAEEAATAAEEAATAAGEAFTAARQAAMDASELDHSDDMGVAAAIKDAEEAETAADKAKTAADEAKTAADEAKTAADKATDADAAEMAAMDAETAQADAETAQADAERAQADAERAQADAEMALGTARTASMAVQTGIDVAAATKAAGTKLTAIQAEAAQTTDAGLGGSDPNKDGTADDGTGVYTLSIERDASATKVTIADPNTAFDGIDDEGPDMRDPDEPQFQKAMDLGTANGFAGSMNVRRNSGDDDDNNVEEVVIVRTDIDAPKATAFAMVSGQGLNAEADGTAVDPPNGDDAVAFDPGDAITVGTSSAAGLAVLANIKSSAFSAAVGDSTQHMFDGTDAGGAGGTDGQEVMGTYNGAAGTYACVGGADCTVTVDGDGDLLGMSDGWIFTPDEGATSDVPDTSYLYYGVWLQKTTEDGATTYNEVETYFGAVGIAQTEDGNVASADVATSGIGLVTGTADYEGNATGVYVKNVTDNEGAIMSATSGAFSALVNLTATFGGGDIGVDDQASITGTVTGFELEHGEANDWSVALDKARFAVPSSTPGNPPESWVNTFMGTTKGDEGAVGGAGAWNGAFYGPAAVEDGDDDGNADPTAPGAVLGEFGANFTDGAVAGAFGAKKQ